MQAKRASRPSAFKPVITQAANELSRAGFKVLPLSGPSMPHMLAARRGMAKLVCLCEYRRQRDLHRARINLSELAKTLGLTAELWSKKNARLSKSVVYKAPSFIEPARGRALATGEMLAIEKLADASGLSRLLMMENAGRSIAEAAGRLFGLTQGMRVVVVAGLGNNGGDGLAAARHLRSLGLKVDVFLLGGEDEIRTQEAHTNWGILKNLRAARLYTLKEHGVKVLGRLLRHADLIIDALLGTGLKGAVRPPFDEAIRLINASHKPVLSVDIPSGLDSDTGRALGLAVKATVTVTLHRPKLGLLRRSPYVGELYVGSIGLPVLRKSQAI